MKKFYLTFAILLMGCIIATAQPPFDSTISDSYEILLNENFEGDSLDSRISVDYEGTFDLGVISNDHFGSSRCFSFGRSNCPANCFDGGPYYQQPYRTTLKITFPDSIFVSFIIFKWAELYGNWGSGGMVYIDEVQFGLYPKEYIGIAPPSNGVTDETIHSMQLFINETLKTIEISISDIARGSSIVLDDVYIFGSDKMEEFEIALEQDTIKICRNDDVCVKLDAPIVRNGKPPYKFEWHDSSGLEIGKDSTVTVVIKENDTASTYYIVKVEDAEGSVATDTVHIELNKPPIIEAISKVAKKGECLQLEYEQTTGYPLISLVWEQDGRFISSEENPTIKASKTEVYTLTVVDLNNCSTQSSCTITVFDFQDEYCEHTICHEGKIIIGPSIDLQGIDDYVAQWSPLIGIISPNEIQTYVSPPETGEYIYKLSLVIGGTIAYEYSCEIIVVKANIKANYENEEIVLDGGVGFSEYYWWYNSEKTIGRSQTVRVTNETGAIYYLEVVDIKGCSDKDTFKIPIKTDVPPSAQEKDLFIFPNPADETVSIEFAEESTMKTINLRINDVLGRKIFSKDLSQRPNIIKIDVSSWTEGFYTIIIESNYGIIVKKLIIK